jgi:hypothetical protein
MKEMRTMTEHTDATIHVGVSSSVASDIGDVWVISGYYDRTLVRVVAELRVLACSTEL